LIKNRHQFNLAKAINMLNPIAEIFSQGEEIICGQVVDTNASWLSTQLTELGFTLARHTAVGDKLTDLVELLQAISQRADLCLCTGGLGPTVDDLTAEAVALAFDCPLQIDHTALTQIACYFSDRGRMMATINQKQAYLPRRATRIDNHWGTAPGFALHHQRCWFVFLPGVPMEMQAMFNAFVKTQLTHRFQLQPKKLVVIHVMGIGESDLQQQINELTLSVKFQLGFRAILGEVQVKLMFDPLLEMSLIKPCIELIVDKIGHAVYGVDYIHCGQYPPPINLLTVIDQLMIQRQWNLSVQESISQGAIAAKCLGYSWIKNAGYQQQDNPSLLETEDEWVQRIFDETHEAGQHRNTNLFLAQYYRGELDPYQSTLTVVVYHILLTADKIYHSHHTLTGSLSILQSRAAMDALDLLRKVLQNCATDSTQ